MMSEVTGTCPYIYKLTQNAEHRKSTVKQTVANRRPDVETRESVGVGTGVYQTAP